MIDNITKIDDIESLCLIKINPFYDYRGSNFETFDSSVFYPTVTKLIPEFLNKKFQVDSFSKSRKNCLRGFHGDLICWKLIQCLYGEVYLQIIDIRKTSKTYGNKFKITLNDINRYQILIPNGCVNAHLCLSDECLFYYKLTDKYVNIDQQLHIKWNNKEYNIQWPTTTPILSERDL